MILFCCQTPSLIPPHLLQVVLEALQKQFGISPAAEISIEADPGTFDVQQLLAYKDLGITRVSMGVQSFQQVISLTVPLICVIQLYTMVAPHICCMIPTSGYGRMVL